MHSDTFPLLLSLDIALVTERVTFVRAGAVADATSRSAMAASTTPYVRGETDIFEYLTKTLQERIMIIDGAMGTMIQVSTACSGPALPATHLVVIFRTIRGHTLHPWLHRSTSSERQSTAGSASRITPWMLRETMTCCL